jgi:uncharacterized membrane protein
MILLLSITLFLLLIIVGKERGLKTFLIFYLNLFLILLFIIFMLFGFNAIVLAIIICILATIFTLFILNGYNKKTLSSFLSVLIVLLIITILIVFIGKNANIQGFSAESVETIGGFSFDIGYNMTNLFIGMYLVCIIGTVIDTSISISSAMNEVLVNNKNINSDELFISGMNVGKDILSTTINTLFFAVVSNFVGFFIWHWGSNIEYLINYKVFAQEVIELLLCFIASILIIPITAYISSKVLLRKNT